MSATTAAQYIQLAKALPPRLQRFLARYPHPSILPAGRTPEQMRTGYQAATPNPFMPSRHPVTGRLHDPKYSLRRQAELVKIARGHGVEELLPYTPKKTEERLGKRVQLGLRVRGTGIGQTVKGRQHERGLMQKIEKRREAMIGMPKLVKEWKRIGPRRWRRYPK